MWMKILGAAVIVALLAGCDTAKETADTAGTGGTKAVGIAEKMKGGTSGGVDEDSGEKAGEAAEEAGE